MCKTLELKEGLLYYLITPLGGESGIYVLVSVLWS